MPLPFPSLSHGTVAFGFFNIDTDLLLLDRLLFFADDFCRSLEALAAATGPVQTLCAGYRIASEDLGDLMGAIHGVRLTGFIGEVYRRFPFPHRAEDFKQHTMGFRMRAEVTPIIERWGEAQAIPLFADGSGREAAIGPYRFDRPGFHQLLRYLERGGYPRWQGELRPDYVLQMRRGALDSAHPLFADVGFED
jgi:hypothetical protein